MQTKAEGSPPLTSEHLDDSWFGRAEYRAIAAELRERLSRAYKNEASRADEPTPPGAAQPGLDDSWFK